MSEADGRERSGPMETAGRAGAISPSLTRSLVAGVLAWLVPGAGHLYLGKVVRALVFFLVVTGFFALGLGLHGKMYRPEAGSPLTYLSSFADLGLGPTYLVLVAAGGGRGDPTAITYEHGNTFLLTAGIMNILLMLDTWDIATGRKR